MLVVNKTVLAARLFPLEIIEANVNVVAFA